MSRIVTPTAFEAASRGLYSILRMDRLPVLRIAERSLGSHRSLAILRWSLVIIFLWFGLMKFTAYEANGIAPLISHSPIMGWLIAAFDVQGAARLIGVVELSTAAMLAAGAFLPAASALGAAMSSATYAITLTFLASTPGVAAAAAGGFPAISADVGQFLLKDLVLLAASLCLLLASIEAAPQRT
jgi:uncharacterized membrane protein YkgB